MQAANHTATDSAQLLPGRWFDGLSSKPRPVMLCLQATPQGPSLRLHPLSPAGAPPVLFTHRQVGWPEAWNQRQPPQRVVVDLRDHGSLEIDAVTDWHAALAAAGERPGMAQRMQTRWPLLLGVALAAAIGLTLFYRYGTPWAAMQLTRWVPLSWETGVAEKALQQMDDGTLKPSQLPAQRQQQFQARFATLVQQTPATLHRYPGYQPPLSLQFRAGMGANAFALPGGPIVMTDGIVKAAAAQGLSDDALVGVLAHEIGHVVQRHATRLVVEQGVLQMGLGLALGDVSGIVASGSALLTGLSYRRSHEREADCFAIDLMRHAALPTAPMGQLLLGMAQAEEKEAQGKAKSEAHPIWSLLSSHPDTVRRATELQQGQAPHCATP